MGYCMDHLDHAAPLCTLLHRALMADDLPVAATVAYLYLLSDLLHNSAAPVKHATQYRTRLQPVLPEVFEGLGARVRRGRLGRLTGGT